MIYNALANGMAELVGGVFSLAVTLIAMVALDLRLSLVVFALLPLLIWVTGIVGKMVREAFRTNQAMIGKVSAHLNESVAAVRVIKSFHKEGDTAGQFREINANARDAGTRAEIVSFAVHPIMRVINGVAAALVVGVGGYLAVTAGGGYSVGLLSAFLIYSSRFFEPLRQITQVYNLIQSALAGAERVFDIMDAEPEITNKDDAVVMEDITGDVRFEGVSFGYEPEQTVVRDVSLEAKSGQVVAIVGPTGAGKTTLVNLLSRFYDVRSGSIRVDGVDIRDMEVNSLRTRMGVVLQEPYFFADTIMANIKYGKPSATDADAMEAATHRRRGPLHQTPAGRLPDHAPRARRQPLRRGTAAPRDRPRDSRGPADPGPRRGDLQRGQPHGGHHPARPDPPHGGTHELHHRPPALDDPRCGPGHRPPQSRYRGARHARRAHGTQRVLCAPLPDAVRAP